MSSVERDRYVYEKLRTAVLTMMAHRGAPKDRLLLAVLANMALLKEQDFPEGDLRAGFNRMMGRILVAAPAGTSVEVYQTAFRWLSEDDIRWIIDRLHSLAFAMAEYHATHPLGSGEGTA